MSIEVKIHEAQTAILRELLFHPSVTFAKLQKLTSMSSDHFNFHLQKLIELKLIDKVARGTYSLTPRGKEYANRLDTDINSVERQPKTAVILAIERHKDGRQEFLFQERLKQPLTMDSGGFQPVRFVGAKQSPKPPPASLWKRPG